MFRMKVGNMIRIARDYFKKIYYTEIGIIDDFYRQYK